jgi:hypothetical protein
MKNMRKFPIAPLFFFFLACSAPCWGADEPDTLFVADISRDTAGVTPKEWTNVLPEKQRVYTEYTVDYTDKGPYIKAVSNSASSWIEKDMGNFDIGSHPILEWEWMVSLFPLVEWERNSGEDDFAIRIEFEFDYRGSRLNPLYLMRKGLITSLFLHNPPVVTLSYVWSVGVPVGTDYKSPESSRMEVVPVESGSFTVRRWFRERRDVLADLKRLQPGEKHLVLKKIRIRSDSESSGTKAESGIRNIVLIRRDVSQPAGK